LFQLLVWSVRSLRGLFCTYEKTAVLTEYFEIVGLEEVEVFLPLARLPISECKNITEAPLLRRQIFGSVNLDPEPFILFGSVAGSEAVRSSSSRASPGSEAVHFFGSDTGLEAVRSFSLVPHRSRSRPSFSLESTTGSGAVPQSGPRTVIW
jgi:hypothetical protein